MDKLDKTNIVFKRGFSLVTYINLVKKVEVQK